jgi:hypothetical protein
MKLKFLSLVCIMLGVTLKDSDGARLPLFDYTGKMILTIKDHQLQEVKEIKHMKALDGVIVWHYG